MLSEPLQFGIVSIFPDASQSIVTLVRNLSAEPISDITITFDIALHRDPSLCHRERVLNGATLGPNESREASLSLNQLALFKVYWSGNPPRREILDVRNRNFIGDGWFDVKATLTFRNSDGFLEGREATAVVGF